MDQTTVIKKRTEHDRYTYSQSNIGSFYVYAENNTPDFQGKLNAVKVGEVLKVIPELDNKV